MDDFIEELEFEEDMPNNNTTPNGLLEEEELVLTHYADDYHSPIFGFLITKYLIPVLLIVGTVGNLLSVAVLWRHGLKKSSTVFYLFVLSIADLVSSFVGMPFLYLADVFYIAPRDHSDFFCKVQTFLTYASTHFVAWLLVAVTIDRFMWVTLGVNAKKFCTTKRAVIVTIVLTILISLANSHFLITLTVDYIPEEKRVACKAFEQYEEFTIKFVPWLDIILLSFLPFFIMAVCNIIIISKLRQLARVRNRMKCKRSASRPGMQPQISNSSTESRRISIVTPLIQFVKTMRKESKRELSLTIMLLTVNIFFIISTLPITILNTLWELAFDHLTDDQKATINQLQSVGSCLLYLNITLHFLLFIFSGKIFRRDFVKLFQSIPILSRFSRTRCFRWVFRVSRNNSIDSTHPDRSTFATRTTGESNMRPLTHRDRFRGLEFSQLKISSSSDNAADSERASLNPVSQRRNQEEVTRL